MPAFTEEQKRIALLLLHEPKTIEEINKQLEIPYDKLSQQMKEMLKLDVVERNGYPPKYRLKENIVKEIRRRQHISEEDTYKIRVKAYVEMQAIEEDLLKKQLDKMAVQLQNEKDFTVYKVEKAEIIKEETYYTSYLDLNFSVKDFTALVKFVFFYGPSTVEIIKPERIELSTHDLQDGLIEMSEMVHKYTEMIATMLNKEQLEKFHRELYK